MAKGDVTVAASDVAAASDATSPRRATGWSVVAVPAALALTLATIRSSQMPLWRDEFATAMYASMSPADLASATSHVDAVIAPYYLVMHVLAPVLGLGVGMRWVSILAFAGASALTASLARRWWGSVAGLVAGLAVACNGELVTAAANARPYALSACFGVLAVVAADSAITSGRRRSWIVFSAAATVAVALQLFALLALATVVTLVVARSRSSILRLVLWSLPPVGTAAALLVAGASHRGQLVWLPEPGVREAILVIARSSGVSADHAVRYDAMLLLVLVATAVLSLAVARSQGRESVGDLVRRRVFALALMVLPAILLFALSWAITPVFSGKYFTWSAFGAALVLAGAVAVARRPTSALGITAAVLAGALLACSVVVSGGRLVDPPQPGDDFPAAVRVLERSAEVGDTLVLAQPYAFGGVAYGFAVSAHDESQEDEVVDHAVAGEQPVLDARTITSPVPLRTVSGEVATSGSSHDTWVITIFPFTETQLDTVEPGLAECLRAMDYEAPTEQWGALRLYRIRCG